MKKPKNMNINHHLKAILFLAITLLFCFSVRAQSNLDTLRKPQTTNTKLPQFRVAAQVGYGYRNAYIVQSTYYSMKARELVPVSNSMKSHLLKLNHNISYGADFSYFLKKYIGFGIRYNGINSSATSSEVLFPLEDDFVIRGSISEKIGIHYIGGFIATRYFLPSNKHCIFANIGAGLSIYKNNLKINANKQILTDNSAAFVAEFGYDFFITQNFAMGLQTSIYFGFLKNFSYINDNGNITLGKSIRQPRRLNLNHIDISIGFRFYK